jgi:hypothetical protein
MSQALGGVKIQVVADDEIKATLVLSKILNGVYASSLQESDCVDLCNNCNGIAFETFNTWQIKLSQIAAYLCFGFVFRLRDRKKKCKDCGGVSHN